MRENQKHVTYTYNEVFTSIENGINFWDFGIKFGISFLEKREIFKLLLICTDNNQKKSEDLLKKLMENTESYIATHVKEDEVLNYNTLFLLAKKGYSRIDIMKHFGKTSYTSFCKFLNKLYSKENIDETKQKKLSEMLKKNVSLKKVTFISNAKEEKMIKEVENSSLTNLATSETSNNSDTPLFSEKLVLYTIEYLQLQGNKIADELFDGANEERVILSSTLSKYMKNDANSELSKIRLTEAINEKKLGVLMATTEYPANRSTNNSIDNDIVLSQALMLRRHTDKTICIATRDTQTAINSLSLGFEIRIPKNILINKFSDITDNNIKNILYYFDYNLLENTVIPKSSSDEAVVILDTCILIGNAAKTAPTNKDKILSDTSQLKILSRVVLDELRGGPQVFFTVLFAAKYNPTLLVDLNMKISYNFNDIAILNYAMYYQLTSGKEVTILTHDKAFYLEALKYNMKVRYYPSTYMDTFSVSKKCTEDVKVENKIQSHDALEEKSQVKLQEISPIVPSDNTEDDFSEKVVEMHQTHETNEFLYHQSVQIHMVSSKPVILNTKKINCVKAAKTMTTVELKGHKGYQYYPVELGDFISFKDDPNLYRLIALSGKNNLESVDLIKLGSGLFS